MLAFGFLAALGGPGAAQEPTITPLRHDLAERTFDAACSACHYRGGGRSPFGTRGPPGDDSPDEVVQYILFGKESEPDEGGMPGFGAVLSDEDVVRLATWMRSQSKPDAPWVDVAARVTAMRATGQRED